MESYVDCLPHVVDAALGGSTETGREWVGKEKGSEGARALEGGRAKRLQ